MSIYLGNKRIYPSQYGGGSNRVLKVNYTYFFYSKILSYDSYGNLSIVSGSSNISVFVYQLTEGCTYKISSALNGFVAVVSGHAGDVVEEFINNHNTYTVDSTQWESIESDSDFEYTCGERTTLMAMFVNDGTNQIDLIVDK